MGEGKWQHQRALALWKRAKGTSTLKSDVDIAIVLIPAQGIHNWAYANYIEQKPQWKKQLETIACCKVDLCPILPDTELDTDVRTTGKLLWALDHNDKTSTY